MARPSIKNALSSSVAAEEKKLQDKFARAEAHLESAPPEEVVAKEQSEQVAKVVREAFTIPVAEHKQIDTMQKFMLSHAVAVTKSEVVRAGLALLMQADDATRIAVFEQLERVKTGRPKIV